jgi:hypothetical protein
MSGAPDFFRRCVLVCFAAAALAMAPTWAAGPLLEEAAAQLLPHEGHQSRVALGASMVKLARAGVIDQRKLEALYARRGGLPAELQHILSKPAFQPMRITREYAQVYVNLLWSLGLANRMTANSASPLNGRERFRYASTGGWTLGKANNGGVYFNSFPIVELSAPQEALVMAVARHSHRPCCNNSTFFQDCNHGSALLGLLALGAYQGLSEAQLYREALAFNAFWFPHQYVHTVLYFQVVKGVDWKDVDARTVMGVEFSSASGWRANVARELQSRGILPSQGSADCSA